MEQAIHLKQAYLTCLRAGFLHFTTKAADPLARWELLPNSYSLELEEELLCYDSRAIHLLLQIRQKLERLSLQLLSHTHTYIYMYFMAYR